MKKLPSFLAARKSNHSLLVQKLSEAIDDLSYVGQITSTDVDVSPYALSLLFPKEKFNRTDVWQRLKEQGIGTSVYYPHPVPRLAWYSERYPQQKIFTNANTISYSSLALPVGPHLKVGDVEYVAKELIEILRT